MFKCIQDINLHDKRIIIKRYVKFEERILRRWPAVCRYKTEKKYFLIYVLFVKKSKIYFCVVDVLIYLWITPDYKGKDSCIFHFHHHNIQKLFVLQPMTLEPSYLLALFLVSPLCRLPLRCPDSWLERIVQYLNRS